MNSQRSSEWACEACTYENNISANNCLICDGLRPADAVYSENLLGDESPYYVYSTGTDEGYRSHETAPISARPSTDLDNVSMGIMLGAIGGAGLALLRGRSMTSGALAGAGYGAVGGLLINESNRVILHESNETGTSPVQRHVTDNSLDRRGTISSYSGHCNFVDRIIFQSDGFSSPVFMSGGFLFSDDLRMVGRENFVEDVDMGYESLIARFGNGNVQTPATESFINSLPSSGFSRPRDHQDLCTTDDDRRDVKNSCSICIEGYQSGEEVSSLPCLHIFHRDCINKWLRQCNSCPICKLSF